MKVALLAGGMGTRLSEMTDRIPKPMVEIGGKPILWHIMKHYAHFGFREFVIALGYKGEVIKDYFINYRHHRSSLVVHLKSGHIQVKDGAQEDWIIHLLDAGEQTQTGGRVRRLMQYVGKEPIMLTYGDGVANVDIKKLLQFHKAHGRLATVTAARPPARFGGLQFKANQVTRFVEKPQIGEGWINGGFMVLEPEVLDYIEGDQTLFERQPLERLARKKQLVAYKHQDFWQCMDTVRDLKLLEELWSGGKAPWKLWKK
ncbi:MAG: glucose-1-phosphate cytidylyltransferase [Elusimicrobia bacterium RIFCSPHIGHO2_02_FULL_57_9]|nr:MAG: glucose-1-phosphate cytidylyltransferase [Elusimicrobia bacterium RIFCSPHIGHO2_02_FULL_57_9]